ncbi:MAG: type IV toxin-antitoxin system AbiEi family antitoxin [Acidobacteria bacterium]|nr:type IV toxin-antitoxin system AbiEi family antitoxin [Acidobacteriota bacterium]
MKKVVVQPGDFSDFVDRLQASGRYTFHREEARAALGVSEIALQSAARRLAAKGRICAPRRGFYVMVPVEYSQSGAPPPSWFIDDLMKFHQHPYYVGLLSAAALHGAAHQQPQEFQVATDTTLRPITVGRSRIRFFLKRHLAETPTTEVKTETGAMRVSTPEATALDLVRYVAIAGQLGNVATVLSELSEKINPERLVKAAQAEVELSVVQRLGFLLEHSASSGVAAPLAEWLATKRPRPVPLRPERKPKVSEKDPRWQILVNERVEADE